MTTMISRNAGYALLLLIMSLGLSGCLSGAGGSSASSSTTVATTTTTTVVPTPTITLTLSKTLPATSANSTNTVTFGNPIFATATVLDGKGAPVPNTVVTFTTMGQMIVFTPTSATALTGANGTASLALDSSSISDAGATSISASAELVTTGSSATTTVTSVPIGVAVNGSSVTLGAMTLGQASISAYGTSAVSVPVLLNGISTTLPLSVTFSSPCVTSGKASLSSPVTSINGVATSTYKDNNCASGSDLITASVTGSSSSAAITVAVPAANNIQFVSAIPAIIGIQGAGASATLPKSSLVKFKVVDNSNNGKAGVLIDFSLLPANVSMGISLSPSSATSDANGEVTVSVTSGTVPTPVWVVAKVHDNPAIASQSNTLTITTGLPAQNFFSLSVQTHNIEGWLYDGVTSALTVIASDRVGNPVPDGTAISFITEGAQILPASCITTDGTCSLTFKSSAYKPIDETTVANPNGAVAAIDPSSNLSITDPAGNPLFVKNGRVTLLAYAVGEKSFLDANGNNIYDVGEAFYDLGDLFIDSNENGTWDTNPTQPNLFEQPFSYAPVVSPVACMTRSGILGSPLPANYNNVPSRDNSCSGVWGINYVRRSAVIVLSGSFAKLNQPRDVFGRAMFTMGGTCSQNFQFWMMDNNNNPMPVGTTVSIADNAVGFIAPADTEKTSATLTVGGTPVLDTNHAGGTLVNLSVDGGAKCVGAGPFPAGTATIVIKTPLDNTTSIPIVVN